MSEVYAILDGDIESFTKSVQERESWLRAKRAEMPESFKANGRYALGGAESPMLADTLLAADQLSRVTRYCPTLSADEDYLRYIASKNIRRLSKKRALVTLEGRLIPGKMSWIDDWFGILTYEEVVATLAYAAADYDEIYWVLNSGGGYAGGSLFEACDSIKNLREMENVSITTLVRDTCCSAAYALACGTNRIYASEGSLVANIGVLATIINRSEAMNSMGLQTYVFRSGDLKGKPETDLPMDDESITVMQYIVSETYTKFESLVMTNRLQSGIHREEWSKGSPYLAKDALPLGLVDNIVSVDDYIARKQQEN